MADASLPTGHLRVPLPPASRLTASVALPPPDGAVTLGVASEPAPRLSTEAYVELEEARRAPGVEAEGTRRDLGGALGVLIELGWWRDGGRVIELRRYAVHGGRALTVTATAEATTFARRRALLEAMVLGVEATDDTAATGRLLARLGRTLALRAGARASDAASADDPVEPTDLPDVAEDLEAPAGPDDRARALAAAVEESADAGAHPRHLLADERFLDGVGLLRDGPSSSAALLLDARSDHYVLACMQLEAVAQRAADERLAPKLLEQVNLHVPGEQWFAVRALGTHAGPSALVELLAVADDAWFEPLRLAILRGFAEHRGSAGERPAADDLLARLPDPPPDHLPELLDRLRDVLPADLVDGVRVALAGRAAVAVLAGVGRVWDGAAPSPATLVTPALGAVLDTVEQELLDRPRRSAVLVAPPGSGKSTAARLLAARLVPRGFTVFEATAGDVLAGQIYIGELEGRVRQIVEAVADRDVLWVVPAFEELLGAGRTRESPRGLLDLLLPHIREGRLRVLGELTPDAYERVARERPQLRSALASHVLPAFSPDENLEVARRWWRAREGDKRAPESLLAEALELARHYLRDRALPAALVHLLERAGERAGDGDDAPAPLSTRHLLLAVSDLTGLPLDLVDERAPLDVEALRHFFTGRVLGQPEAVECLVERVALLKAGLTDPTRPQGVFLFVGPTGTGKTEIAKTLAAYLFGSPDRMIRLDMSELQDAGSLDRVLGEAGALEPGRALVEQIAAQPFSVVLLDEFEKAHRSVWDLFLQVFDDGRLTDRRGRTVDFRHCIVIITSNLGAAIATGSVGFAPDGTGFASAGVERAVSRAFRPEFLNRLDRVVVFRPLARETMRELLRHELAAVLERRGLRTREWAIEWDESAVEFLLEQGFTPELGARPLRRAIDRHLLAPLALTIVARRYPEGDQFLFVRSPDGTRLEVVFIDPDAPPADGATAPVEQPGRTLRAVALDPAGTAAEWSLLHERYAAIRDAVASPAWQERKARALGETSTPGFWEDPRRFAVLGLAEYMDRIEAGVRGAGALAARLDATTRGGRVRPPRELIEQLAERLVLLEQAREVLDEDAPRDAFLLVAHAEPAGADVRAFAGRLGEMYRRWARRRRMRTLVLDDGAGGGPGLLLAVSGFGAHRTLAGEAGLHVFEEPREGGSFDRVAVRVRVAAQADEPLPPAPVDARRHALAALDAAPGAEEAVVRRYRERPSPLVRDGRRGWRTGRLDRVLDGEFDLFE